MDQPWQVGTGWPRLPVIRCEPLGNNDVPLSRLGRSGGDEPGIEAIRGLQQKLRTLNTWLSSGTSAETFASSLVLTQMIWPMQV